MWLMSNITQHYDNEHKNLETSCIAEKLAVISNSCLEPIQVNTKGSLKIYQLTLEPGKYLVGLLVHCSVGKFLVSLESKKSVTTKEYHIGLIQVNKEGWTGFFKGWRGCSKGFPEGKALREMPRKTLSIPTLLLGFVFYLKKETYC